MPTATAFAPIIEAPLRGFADQPDARGLGPAFSPDCQNVDLTEGTLKGIWGPGTSVATPSNTNPKAIAWLGEAAWWDSAYPDWTLNDARRRVNFVLNGSVESQVFSKNAAGTYTGTSFPALGTTTGFTLTNIWVDTARYQATPDDGAYVMRIVTTAGAGAIYALTDGGMGPFVAGTSYTFTLRYYIPTANGITSFTLDIVDSVGTTTSSSYSTTGSWGTATVTRTINAAATTAYVRITITGAASRFLNVDKLVVAPSSFGSDFGVSYRTAHTNTAGDAPGRPQLYLGSTSGNLGLIPPAIGLPGAGAAGALTRSWVLTSVSYDGSESNPSGVVTWTSGANTIGGLFCPAVESTVAYRRLWAADTATPSASTTWRLIGTVQGNAEITVTAAAASVAIAGTEETITWGVGGRSDYNGTFRTDRSPWPAVRVFSTGMHTKDDGGGTAGAGILFGAGGDGGRTVYWSVLGFPQYQPIWAYKALAETVRAIVSKGPFTYVFTDSNIQLVTGMDDESLSFQALDVKTSVISTAGKTCVASPMGIFFLSREGLMLIEGTGTRNLTAGLIKPYTLKDCTMAAWYDGCYFLGDGATVKFIFDFRGGEMKVSKCNVSATAFHVTPFDPTSASQGLYVGASTTIKPWRPNDESGVTGAARQVWYWNTPRFTMGQAANWKEWFKVRVSLSGDTTIETYLDGSGSAKQTGITGDSWLAKETYGEDLKLKISSAGGSGAFRDGYVTWRMTDAA